MEEFFDFEEAATAGLTMDQRRGWSNMAPASSSSCDIGQILAQATNRSSAFSPIQQLGVSPSHTALPYHNSHVVEQEPGQLSTFHQFSEQSNNATPSTNPCMYCQAHGLECYVIPTKSVRQDGACTACSALSQWCNFASGGGPESLELTESMPSYEPELLNYVEQYTASGRYDTLTSRSAFAQTNIMTDSAFSQTTMKDDASESSGKSVARFSRETVRILRNWVSSHRLHPYPTEEEKEDLTRKTGLTKVQVTNWLANARRRGQVKTSRSKSPGPHSASNVIAVPKQAGLATQQMNPMERWKSSLPEHEPASVTDIAKAARTSPVISFKDASPRSYPRSEAGSPRSVTSGRHTSHSSRASFTSSHSRQSHGSFGRRGGRRRRRPVSKTVNSPSAAAPRQFQCTFCIETFKTKHDWQRHEKSLHLSLERWICAYNINSNTDAPGRCAFCGFLNPDRRHYERHNYTACQERSLEERTFYRKDHLRQHLRLVHDCQFLASTMDAWKIAAPKVRSRCGFCGLKMDTWTERTDHIAEHFKSGKTMADWQGSWGFDLEIQRLVEDGLPPYLIHSKRIAVVAQEPPLDIDRNILTPYDEIKAKLLDFVNKQTVLGHVVTDDGLKAEAARSLSEFKQKHESGYSVNSWFRDLITCPEETQWLDKQMDNTAVRAGKQARVYHLPNNAFNKGRKENTERYCEFERQLVSIVDEQRALGNAPTDLELRMAACRIIIEYDKMYSKVPSGRGAAWFCDQAMNSHCWIARFRQRNGLPPNAKAESEKNSLNERHSPGHTRQTLEARLTEFVNMQITMGTVPADETIQRQARLITYDVDDPFLQTMADNPLWLAHFKSMYRLARGDGSRHPITKRSPGQAVQSNPISVSAANSSASFKEQTNPQLQFDHVHGQSEIENCGKHQHLKSNLFEYISGILSQHTHLPTDDEMRRQARLVVYNNDNPTNLTLADNPEWLLNFKRSVGIFPPADLPFAPQALNDIAVQYNNTPLLLARQGSNLPLGTAPKMSQANTPLTDNGFFGNIWPGNDAKASSAHAIPLTYGTTGFPMLRETDSKLSTGRLEIYLASYVSQSLNQGIVPSDEQLRIQIRALVGTTVVVADELMLLKKFKKFYHANYGFSLPDGPHTSLSQDDVLASNLPHTSEDANKLTAYWKPARSGSKSKCNKDNSGSFESSDYSYYMGSTIPNGRIASSATPAFPTTHIDASQGYIDPQLWDLQQYPEHLEDSQTIHEYDDVMME